MAAADCTRECRHCGKDIPHIRRVGRRREFCNPDCRRRYRGEVTGRKTHKPGGPCSVAGCAAASVARGFCQAHYSRHRTGRPLDTPVSRKGERIAKPCGWCGAVMALRPAIANRQECCSVACGQKLRAQREGKQSVEPFYCAGCHSLTARKVRSAKDDGKYCCRECYAAKKIRVSLVGARRRDMEREALRAEAELAKADRLFCVCVECGSGFRQATHWGCRGACMSCMQGDAQG